jgi:hypothetical protein
MQNKINNSETPYFSTSPVQDQFGTLIVAFGITKREKLAFDIYLKFKRFHSFKEHDGNINEIIAECYKQADIFLNFEIEGQKENLSKIIL